MTSPQLEGRCRLCLREPVVLCHSHILPEFLYEGAYDEKHRTVGIDPRPDQKNRILQKGLREYLLCQQCETHLSFFERYGAEILRSFPSTEKLLHRDIILINNVTYRNFKIFQMSILRRCGVSEQPTFSDVDLWAHEERLRRRIIGKQAGEPWEYGCVIVGLRGPGSLKSMVKFPGNFRIQGHIAYHLVVFGLVWLYVVSSHAKELNNRGFFLSKKGELPIRISSETAEGFFQGVAQNLRKIGKVFY